MEKLWRWFRKKFCFFEKSLDIPAVHCYNGKAVTEQRTEYGGIAQLGERLNGIQEVSGSIPLISTKRGRRFAHAT